MKRGLLLILLLGFKLCSAQLLDSLSLDTVKTYRALGDAKINPDKVIKLVLTKQKLTEVPEAIRQFKNLQYLDLSHNKITSVPAWIGDLKSLQKLVLSHNEIDTLPPQIGQLSNLKWFIMNRDPLNAIPDALGDLSELRYLDMWGDNIDYFPSSLKKLTKLYAFDLRDILIPQSEQDKIKSYLPHTTVYISPACPCER